MGYRDFETRVAGILDDDVAEIVAAAHSLRKWQGLTKANLARHDVVLHNYRLVEANNPENWLNLDSSSCALCETHDSDCDKCPLAKVRGNVSCDSERYDEAETPYWDGAYNEKPMPMIRWLKAAVAYEAAVLSTEP